MYNQRSAGSGAILEERASSSDTLLGSEEGDNISAAERKVLDRVADALARLGRVKRVGLGVKDKQAFVDAWNKHGSR